MSEGNENKNPRFQLRYAAGQYWLLDMWQEGVPYKKPIAFNEVGADIWRMMEQGRERQEIAKALCAAYSVNYETALEDVVQFQKQLRDYERSCSVVNSSAAGCRN